MTHSTSPDDQRFRAEFEAGTYPLADFDHRAHVRLAYVYLVDNSTATALALMRKALKFFLERNGVDLSKYHETMTRAWILAVRHFMERPGSAASADEFIAANPELLDSKIMLTHYSVDTLFSPQAREQFVEPDLDPIPRHE